MKAAIYSKKLGECITVHLYEASAEHPKGYWVYDAKVGHCIAWACRTEDMALAIAFDYLHKKLEEVQAAYTDLQSLAYTFAKSVISED